MSAAPKRSRFSDKPEPSADVSAPKLPKTDVTPAWKLPESALVPLGGQTKPKFKSGDSLCVWSTAYYLLFTDFCAFLCLSFFCDESGQWISSNNNLLFIQFIKNKITTRRTDLISFAFSVRIEKKRMVNAITTDVYSTILGVWTVNYCRHSKSNQENRVQVQSFIWIISNFGLVVGQTTM